MKKTYMTPSQKIAELDMTDALLAGSLDTNAISQFSLTGDEYDEGDVSYTKQQKTLWDEAW